MFLLLSRMGLELSERVVCPVCRKEIVSFHVKCEEKLRLIKSVCEKYKRGKLYGES